MKRFIPTLLALAVSSALHGQALAETTATSNVDITVEVPLNATDMAEVDQAITASAQPAMLDPGMQIEEMIAAYRRGEGQGFVTKSSAGKLYFGIGQANVMLRPESRDWGNARVMAYKEALLNAKADYLTHLGTRVVASSATRLFDDASQMPQFTPQELTSRNRLEEVLNKAVAVAGGVLDEQLVELGIDPDEFRSAPSEKRAVLFERSVSNAVTQRARHELTGVIPVKSFEANDADGNHVVAVAIVASPKMRAFIDDVIASKGDIAANPDKASAAPLDQLFADKNALINEFGIRRMYDDQGYPVLVSFGQSGNPYRGQDFQQLYDNRKVSFATAQADAFGNFATLFKSTGTFDQSSSRVMQNRRVGIVRAEGRDITESEESSRDFIQALEQEMEASGRVNDLAGTRELMRWTAKHPTYGHEINGVIYVWHPVSEQNARAMRDNKPRQKAQAEAQADLKGQAGSSQSMKLMSADDF